MAELVRKQDAMRHASNGSVRHLIHGVATRVSSACLIEVSTPNGTTCHVATSEELSNISANEPAISVGPNTIEQLQQSATRLTARVADRRIVWVYRIIAMRLDVRENQHCVDVALIHHRNVSNDAVHLGSGSTFRRIPRAKAVVISNGDFHIACAISLSIESFPSGNLTSRNIPNLRFHAHHSTRVSLNGVHMKLLKTADVNALRDDDGH
mmetsp:Transcript_3566/g.9923  ORF Transcript_3566/g.9923 Transcript_3566/m.9923 type:complete len:210 (+) Transcript_3566:2519-3148(+)